MKKTFLLSICVFFTLLASANSYFFAPVAKGDETGRNWENVAAGEYLGDILQNAQPGDCFYLQAGKYYPTAISFPNHANMRRWVIPMGVQLIGGYPDSMTGDDTQYDLAKGGQSVFSADLDDDGVGDNINYGFFYVGNGNPHEANDDYYSTWQLTTIKGITFSEGYRKNSMYRGNMVFIQHAKVDFYFCQFLNNNSWRDNSSNTGSNGAIEMWGSLVRCFDCIFRDNKTANGSGAAFQIRGRQSAVDSEDPKDHSIGYFERCEFTNNIAFCTGTSTPENQSWGTYGGTGGVADNSGSLYMINCTVTGSRVWYRGSGLRVSGGDKVYLISNTFVDNECVNRNNRSSNNGSAVSVGQKSKVYMANNIMVEKSTIDDYTSTDAVLFMQANVVHSSAGYNMLGTTTAESGATTSWQSTDNKPSSAATVNTMEKVFGSNTIGMHGGISQTIMPTQSVSGMSLSTLQSLPNSWGMDDAAKSVIDVTKDQRGYTRSSTTMSGAYDKNAVGKKYTVAVSSNDSKMGSATGGCTAEMGATITVKATVVSGYQFLNWTEKGKVVSTEPTYTFSLFDDRELVANFSSKVYTISVLSSSKKMGTVEGGGNYQENASVMVKAVPKIGYGFDNWTEEGVEVSKDASYTFKATANRSLVANFVKIEHTVTVVSSNVNYGTVSGGGTMQEGREATIVATPKWGYQFVNWTENDQDFAKDAEYRFTVKASHNLVGNFAAKMLEVIAFSADESKGTVSGAGSYQEGVTVTVTATPNKGYKFLNWTEAGKEVSTMAQYAFTIEKARDLKANFVAKTYRVTTTSANETMGSVSAGDDVQEGKEFTVTATANAGYRFVNWLEGANEVSTEASYTFEVSQDRALKATFAIKNITIAAVPNETKRGSVVGAGDYRVGETATLTAISKRGYQFVGWVENTDTISRDKKYTFTVAGDRSLVAWFAELNRTISVSSSDETMGTVAGGGTVQEGQDATVVATPKSGCMFVAWKENGLSVSTSSSYTFEVEADRILVGQFAKAYTVALQANNPSWGTVYGAGKYAKGSKIIIKAVPQTGYKFMRWEDAQGAKISENNVMTIVLESDINYTAVFEKAGSGTMCNVVLSSADLSQGTVSGGGEIEQGMLTTIMAKAKTGYIFTCWKNQQGVVVSSDAVCEINVQSDTTLIAYFAERCKATANINKLGAGTVTGAGVYAKNQQVLFLATPSQGYQFNNWTDNKGNVLATDIQLAITIVSDTIVRANFVKEYTITLQNEQPQMGEVTGGDVYVAGAIATVEAQANQGYQFLYWKTPAGYEVSKQACYSFEVTKNITLVASFAKIVPTYMVEVASADATMGSALGGGMAADQTEMTVLAIPYEGYAFVNWTDEQQQEISQQTSYTFFVQKNIQLVANFTKVIPTYSVQLNVNDAEQGSVKGDTVNAKEGTFIKVVAMPKENHRFVRWTNNDGYEVSSSAEYGFILKQDVKLIAVFEPIITYYSIQGQSSNNQFGAVMGSAVVEAGTNVTLSAFPYNGYDFKAWTIQGDTLAEKSAQITILAQADTVVVAHFAKVIAQYEVKCASADPTMGEVSGAGIYDEGQLVCVAANQKSGYRFMEWTDENGFSVSADSIYTFRIKGNVSLVAHFVKIVHCCHVFVSAANPERGYTSASLDVEIGQKTTVKATPYDGYEFVMWTDEKGTERSRMAEYTFYVNDDMTLVAQFQRINYTVTLLVNDKTLGTVSGAGEVRGDSLAHIIATANTGVEFINWTDTMGFVFSTVAECQFVVKSNVVLMANFKKTQKTVNIQVYANDYSMGEVSGGGEVAVGTKVTVEAVAYPNYKFVHWVNDSGKEVSTKASYTVTALSSRVLIAVFESNPTDLESTDAESATQKKFIKNNQLYIQTNGNLYDAKGQQIK